MASIAVLPILIGLGVDYAIQFQARFVEAAGGGITRPARGGRGRGERAGRRSSPRRSPPAPASAPCSYPRSRWCAASGSLLVAGIALALALALTAGLAALSLDRRGSPRSAGARIAAGRRRAGSARTRAAALAALAPRPWRVLAVAAVLAVLGWVAGSTRPRSSPTSAS